jgi:hypothetical protein
MKKIATVVLATVSLALAAAPAQSHFYAGCQKDKCKAHVVAPYRAELRKIHNCESRNWFLDSTYDGGLQFSPGTWNATGSAYAYAYQAPILEQKYRGVIWAHKINWNWHSTAGWPVCG